MRQRRLVIAIDGPAGSGKSTTAKLVAEKLGYLHIDTGAMYRAVALKVLRSKIDPHDAHAIEGMLRSTKVELRRTSGTISVLLDGEEVSREIRTPEVTHASSAVSRHKVVRQAMVREQRRMGEEGGVVLEGRDIGTVVFPDADLKFFVVAHIEERARRRQKDLRALGRDSSVEELIGEMEERDRRDSTREESPLRRASDALELDTSCLTIDDQVRFVLEKVREKLRET